MAKPWRSEDLTLTTKKALQSYESDRELKLKTAEVQKLNAELKHINQTLEHTVHERTLQLQATVKELQILSQLKDDFLHAVSHDLRTPVAGMLMILRRLQNKVPSEAQISSFQDSRSASPVNCSIASVKVANDSLDYLKRWSKHISARFTGSRSPQKA